jgi:RecG-like helicase
MEQLLASFLTKSEQTKLISVGLESVFSIITYFPYTYQQIIPFDGSPLPKQRYLVNATITSSSQIFKGKKKYLKLDLDIGTRTVSCFMFTFAPYIFKQLQVNTEIQAILIERGGFWNIEKFAPKKQELADGFKLGSSKIQPYLLCVYPKNGLVTNNLLQKIHSKLPSSLYTLDLTGLAPENTIFPSSLSLRSIHLPTSLEEAQKTKQEYIAFKSFLRMCLIHKANQKRETKIGKPTNLDKTYLQTISKLLPYSLSLSQKTAVWDILVDLKT